LAGDHHPIKQLMCWRASVVKRWEGGNGIRAP